MVLANLSERNPIGLVWRRDTKIREMQIDSYYKVKLIQMKITYAGFGEKGRVG
jgi:hypothetical protein